jgi:hypothetical protein
LIRCLLDVDTERAAACSDVEGKADSNSLA